jgi:hypothetical protein
MLINRTSPFTGKINVMNIEFTPEEAENFCRMEERTLLGVSKWHVPGKLIQDAFPSQSPDVREFLMTGITPEEWNDMFADDDAQGPRS